MGTEYPWQSVSPCIVVFVVVLLLGGCSAGGGLGALHVGAGAVPRVSKDSERWRCPGGNSAPHSTQRRQGCPQSTALSRCLLFGLAGLGVVHPTRCGGGQAEAFRAFASSNRNVLKHFVS